MLNKKVILSLVIITAGFCGTLIVGSALATSNSKTNSMEGFVAGDCTTSLNLTDGQIDPFWECISEYENVSEFGSGGYVKFANNGSHLFALVVCSTDNEWISFEFDPDPSNCMEDQHDGWSFYIDETTQTVEVLDVHFIGTRIPEVDDFNDLLIESIFSGDRLYIEVSRPFATQVCDSTGCDIVYMNASLNMVQFASNSDHFGTHTIYYLIITDEPIGGGAAIIPELPVIINYDEIKISVLNLTLAGVFIFIILHLIRRVIFSPIKHDSRVILNSSDQWETPSLKKRWSETFSSEK